MRMRQAFKPGGAPFPVVCGSGGELQRVPKYPFLEGLVPPAKQIPH